MNQILSYKDIRDKLIYAFVAIVIIVTSISLVSYWFIYQATTRVNQVMETDIQETLSAFEVEHLLTVTESNLREILIESKSGRSVEVDKALVNVLDSQATTFKNIPIWLNAMKEDLGGDSDDDYEKESAQIERLEKLFPEIKSFYTDVNRFLILFKSKNFKEADDLFEDKIEPRYRTLSEVIQSLRAHSKNEIISDIAQINSEMRSSLIAVFAIVISIFILAIFLGYTISKIVVERIIDFIGKIKESENKAIHIARHDILTDLPNRLLFNKELHNVIESAKYTNMHFALLMIDIDHFKYINDTYGHQIGDKFLQEVSSRLLATVRHGDLVARIGGDEFAAIILDMQDPTEAGTIAKKIITEIKKPFKVHRHTINSSASVGISNYPISAQSGELLIKNADVALYYAKQNGRNNYQFYTKEIGEQHQTKLTIYNYLFDALDKNQLHMRYQPIVSLQDNKIVAIEALLHWQHPILGNVPTEEFIPIAEKHGLIGKIGNFALRQACHDFAKIYNQSPHNYKLLVNVSPYQISEGFVEDVRYILQETHMPPHKLELEITETAVMSSILNIEGILIKLNGLGVHVVVDDFGTGYSSLSRLQSLPVTTLKIDKSFLHDLSVDSENYTLIVTMLALAKKLNLDVIAEGVETKQQLDLLSKSHCPNVQGYYVSKPLDVHGIENLLKQKLT